MYLSSALDDYQQKHFADYGSEKMIFDARMGPQSLYHKGVIYVVYQANEHDMQAHPHIAAYDCETRIWSGPVRLGENPPRYDHHKGPIVWIDGDDRLHVLYGCHITPGTHLVARKPRAIDEWDEAPQIAGSISYPTMVRVCGDKWLLFYRGLGHLGFWAYKVSDDGGFSWSDARRLIDFDWNPREDDDADTWAGSYVSVAANSDGRSLHIGFVYWDEKNRRHPVYDIGKRSKKRHNLYYLRLDIPSGALYTIDGKKMATPVNRGRADESCKVWDTGHELSNMSSVAVDQRDEPCFLLPVSDGSPWHCHFHFVSRRNGDWHRTTLTETNGNWAGCFVAPDGANGFVAYLVAGEDGENLLYGGGVVEEWRSKDMGVTWRRERSLVPEPHLVFNNPKPVQCADGSRLDDHLVFFGWQGPGSIQADPSPARNRGRAYLWGNEKWL